MLSLFHGFRGKAPAEGLLEPHDWRGRDPAAYRAFAARFVARMLALQAEAEAARATVAPAPRAHP